jgi:hypothetical protein
MKDTENNIKNSFSEFQRYIRGEMTKGEESSFRLKLQDGPFAQAIIEGCFSGFSLRRTAKVIDYQDKSLRRSDQRSGKRIFIYSITTVVAVLMISYAGYIIFNNNIHAWFQRSSIFTPGPPEARGSSQVTGNYQAGSIFGSDSIETDYSQNLSTFNIDTTGSALMEIVNSGLDTGEILTGGLKDSGIVAAGDNISDTVISSGIQSVSETDPEPLDEIKDTVGKAVSETAVHQAPQPADGDAAFKNYIDANIKTPVTQTQGAETVAVVSFLVRATGLIDSIKVIGSPGEEYSREAIRLIREGPAWKPAEENGKATDEEVRLRIVFK